MSGEDDDIFGRWSRRKRAVAEEARAETPVPAPAAPEGAAPPADETEADMLARLGLPDPDTLGKGDDFSAFMRAGVPDVIRRRALRRLWTSNPVLANLDGLNDYDDDYAAAALSPKVVATVYKVGRGLLKDMLEEAPKDGDVPDEAAEPAAARGATEEAEGEAPATGVSDSLSHPSAGSAMPPKPADPHPQDQNPLRPKRMRFRTNS